MGQYNLSGELKMTKVMINDKEEQIYTDAVSPITFTLPELEHFRVYDRETLIELAMKCMMLAIDWHEV